uniref:Uncharacterized protein n=1 Tax=Pseudourostyla cristata TaxID=293816 RepID=A0A4P9JLG7_9SPIT|nr:hypothetical protein [Pseudourostyla cristata]
MKLEFLFLNFKSDSINNFGNGYNMPKLVEFGFYSKKNYFYKNLTNDDWISLIKSNLTTTLEMDKNNNLWLINDYYLIEILLENVLTFNFRLKIIYVNDLKYLLIRIMFYLQLVDNKNLTIRYFISNNKYYYIEIFNKQLKCCIVIKNIFLFFPQLENNLYDQIKVTFLKNIQTGDLLNATGHRGGLVKQILFDWNEHIQTLNKQIKAYIPIWHKNRYSISTIAKKIFLNKFNTFGIQLILDVELDTILRTGYFSGRNEIFANSIHDEKILYFDFPNMYGTIMLGDFFWGKIEHTLNPINHSKPGIFRIKAYSHESNYYPILPFKLKNLIFETPNQDIFYANGEIEGWFTHELLDYFLSSNNQNKIISYYESYTYINTNKKPIFKKFAQHFIDLKNTSTGDNKKLYKLILNSLPGILALKPNTILTEILDKNKYERLNSSLQRQFISKEIFEFIDKNNFDKLITNLQQTKSQLEILSNFLYLIQYENIKINATRKINSNVLFSIFINSRAAIKLHQNMMFLTNLGARILAVNTDSIYIAVLKSKYDKFIDTNLNDVYFSSKINKTKIKKALFINTHSYFIKYEHIDEPEIYLFNRPNSSLKEFDYELALKQDFNQQFITIGNMIEMNSYKKRIWTNLNINSKPFFYKNNKFNEIL